MSTSAKETSRAGMLFVTYQCPSFGGSGPQIRSAALVRMLAARGDVHVLIVNRYWKMPGPCDACEETGAAVMTYVRIRPDVATAGRWIHVESDVSYPELNTVECGLGEMGQFVAEYARENHLSELFVFRMEALAFVQGGLDLFAARMLDLDELPSRRQRSIAGLRGAAPDPVEVRARLTLQVLEKRLVPRFDHVFVSSAAEAEEVRRQTGFAAPAVLPNIRPVNSAAAAAPHGEGCEMLFVGVLSYFPNTDGVLWFCREVLPLLRKKRGDEMRLRIVGFRDTAALDPIRNMPGVVFAGYQPDLAPCYARAAMAVVPLRAGSGTRLKILEAFAYGRPVVSTSIGAEGLEVTHGKNILLADTAESFCAACISLIEQPELAGRLADGAGALCRERYSEEALLRCYDAVRRSGQAPAEGAGHNVGPR